jgi:hypothetical protein
MPNLSPFDLPRFHHTNPDKSKVRNVVARTGFLFLHLKYLIPLLLLFTLNVSPSKAQGASFWPGQERIPEYFDSTKDPPDLIADTNRSVHAFHAQPLLLNDKGSQASNTIWSEPILLFQEDGAREIHGPSVISDSYGNVHVFWTVPSGSPGEFDLIYYARLDALGWTTPVDIVAAAPARGVNAAISQDGIIYLIWSGFGGISYSHAPIQGAEYVKNWSKPVLLTDANFYADLFTSSSGKIYLAYPGVDASGVFEQFLEPNNLNWSSSRIISQTSLTNSASDYVQIRVSNNGTMHVVWTEFYYPESWPPRGVFYSRSIDGGNTWSAPEMMAGDGFDQINITVVDDENIHVAWNGMVTVGGRYHRWSSDGGQTWSETAEVIPAGIGGTEGFPQLVVDQSGTLHMLTTYQGGCVWYTYFNNQTWVPPICISGEKTLIEEPSMTVSEGNKLHAVFWDNRKSLWYTTKVTDASWIPPEIMENELLQPTRSPVPTGSPVITPTLSSTSVPVGQQLDAPSKFSLNSGQLLILSLSPVILLVFLMAALVFFKKKR